MPALNVISVGGVDMTQVIARKGPDTASTKVPLPRALCWHPSGMYLFCRCACVCASGVLFHTTGR